VAIITAVSKPKAGLGEGVGDGLRVVSAEGDESVDLVGLEHLDALLNAALDLADVGARSAQDGAALEEDAVDALQGQWGGFVLENAAPALEESDEFVAVVVDSLLYHRMNDGIQTRAVSAARQHTDSHSLSLPVAEIEDSPDRL
jgi:hypothetical protein